MENEKPKYLTPSPQLLIKLGSLIVHIEEMLSKSGHYFDLATLEANIKDEDVQKWIKEMGVLLPKKR